MPPNFRSKGVQKTVDRYNYLKVLCDEVIGRKQFVANIVWQKRTSRENRAAIGSAHDHILLYAKSGPLEWKNSRNPLPANEAGYSNPDNDPRGPWRSIPFSAQGYRKNQMYKIRTPAGLEVDPPKGRCWAATEPEFLKLLADKRVYFPNNGTGRPKIKQFRGEEKGLVPMTWWDAAFAGDNEDAKKEILALFPDQEPFGTPKPEKLLQQIIQIVTDPGDWVLDSFAGSGTTGAVAHKMGRRWIMVELGEHCHTHIIPRLKKVIDGSDQGGISQTVGWKGGGGFRYFQLAPSLLEKDKWGNWVINKTYKPEMLTEAVCKLEGFIYAPSDTVYWQHGYSTERDFIYVTTQHLSYNQLQQLSDDVGEHRSLLVMCTAFRAKADRYPNLTEEEARNVLIYHQKQLVTFIHAQMQTHHWEKATGYDVVVSKGFTELKPSAFSATATDTIHDFRQTVQDRTRIAQMLFGGFQRCLYPIQKFQSDSERRLAIILDREALKWFKPARGQFQLYYKLGADHLEYQPDFVAETVECIYMLEAKARSDMLDTEVQVKKDAAVQWCGHATLHAVSNGGKPWKYLLIPHDVITENMTLIGLASQYCID